MRRLLIAVLVPVMIGVMAEGALASSVHLKGGPRAEPSFTDNGLTLEAAGELAGLGEGDIFVEVEATGNVTATCTNPAGATQPPGQNPAPVTVKGGEPIPETEIKNGNLPFDVETDEPVTPIPGAPECPNPKWTEDITDVAFTSATIRVSQGGVLVLTVSCTFSSPTADGPVPGSNVSCTSS